MEQTECGAACLAMVLGHYRRFVPLTTLRRECGVTRDGSKAANIVRAARRFGLEAKGFRKEMERLREVATPCIVFWQFNHFIVVERFGKRWIDVNDPARGHYRMRWDEFEQGFTGVVLVMQPGPEFQPAGQAAKLLPVLASRMRRFIAPIVFICVCGVLLLIPAISMPAAIGVFIDEVIQAGRFNWLRPLTLIVLTLLAFQLAVLSLQLHVLRRLQLAVGTVGSTGFFWHALSLPVSFYQQRYAGEVATRIGECDRVANVLAVQLPQRFVDVIAVILFAVVLCLYDSTLFFIAVGQAVLVLVLVQWISTKRREMSLRVSQETGKLSGVAIAGIQNMDMIRLTGAADGFFVRVIGHLARATVTGQEMERLRITYRVLPDLASGLATTAILIVGGYKVIAGDLSLGGLFAFQALCSRFLGSTGSLVSFVGNLHEVHGSILRLDDITSAEQDSMFIGRDQELSTAILPAPLLRGEIDVREISFGFSPLDPPVVKSVSIHIMPGQRIAFVGGSGSGKSTIARMIAGLYVPQSGEIWFDDRPRNDWPIQTLTGSIAMVDQEILLFEGTVRENLTLWDTTVSEDTLTEACADAGILDVILELPGGLDAMLQENGANLSGGQRQRLEIARALVNNPSILILDEATSSLDESIEATILENLARRGCTIIAVAHRLSTVRQCDHTLVIRKGVVIEQGTHDQLLAIGGEYTRLIAAEVPST